MSPSTSEDDIELANREHDVPRFHGPENIQYGSQEEDSDNDFGQGDEGEMALLGSSQRARGRERIEAFSLHGWHEMKGIVIEVSPCMPCFSCTTMTLNSEHTDPLAVYGWVAIHRRTIVQIRGEFSRFSRTSLVQWIVFFSAGK
jgi:hypothetical protein